MATVSLKHSTGFAFGVAVALTTMGPAASQESAQMVLNGEQATLAVFGGRPVDLAAKKLVDEFGVAINVEDPVYMFWDDMQDIGVTRSGSRLLVPKASPLEIRFTVRPDRSLSDVGQVVNELADAANTQLPFSYRIDRDRDVFTLVATRTRDEQGRSIELTPILDRRVTISPGTRKIFEHVDLLTESLQQQTGIHVSCCQTGVAGIPWGSTVISFEAHDEPARSVLLRLIRNEPGRDRFVRIEHTGASRLVKADPTREHWHWLVRCQPGYALCVINVAPVPEKP